MVVGQGSGDAELTPAEEKEAQAMAPGDEDWRDWAGLPEHVLVMVAEKHIAQTEAGWAAWLQEHRGFLPEKVIQWHMAKRKADGNCLLVFALVCKEWRKAQLKVGGPLCSRAVDVIMPGSVALVKWALAEGCPRDDGVDTMAHVAASIGHLELVKWLCGEGGLAIDGFALMSEAVKSGNLRLVQWLSSEGCETYNVGEVCWVAAKCGHVEVLRWARANGYVWDESTCEVAVDKGRVEVLRWARENGCPWTAETRDTAAAELGYTDDLGNLVDDDGYSVDEDDEYGYDEYSYE